MKLRLLAASVAAALPLVAGVPAGAADLGDEPPPPRYGSYKDDYREPPPPPPRRYSSCVPKDVVRQRLVSEGWRDFRNPEIRGETALFTARRPSGVRFLLRVDRCSGEVIRAHRLTPRREPTYAAAPRYDFEYYGPRVGVYSTYRPWRWSYYRDGRRWGGGHHHHRHYWR